MFCAILLQERQNNLQQISPTAKLNSEKTLKFRKLDLKMKTKSMRNQAGLLLHKFLCELAHISQEFMILCPTVLEIQ